MLVMLRWLGVRDLACHRGRSAVVVAAIALGSVAWTATWALRSSLDAAFQAAALPAVDADLIVSGRKAPITESVLATIRALPGVRTARPRLVERGRLRSDRALTVTLIGVDPSERRTNAGINDATVRLALLRSRLSGRLPVLASPDLWAALGRRPQRLEALVAGRGLALEIVAELPRRTPSEPQPTALLVTDRHRMATALRRGDVLSRIDVNVEPETPIEVVRARIVEAAGGRAEVVRPEALADRALDSIAALRTGFALCGIAGLVLTFVLITSVMRVSVAQREATIGLMRALGASRSQVLAQILGEALVLGLIGTGVGIPLGCWLAWAGLGPLTRVVADVIRSVPETGLRIETSLIGLGLLVGVGTSVAAALTAARQAATIPPIRAMQRSGPLDDPERRRRWAWVVPGGAGLLGLACVIPIGSRVASYGTLALAAIGAIGLTRLLTRPLALLIRPVVERVAGLPGRLAIDGIAATPARAGTAIAGLTASIALIIQTGGVIASNERAVRDWVDHGIVGDLFVTCGGPLSASGRSLPMDSTLQTSIEQTIAEAVVVPMRFRRLAWPVSETETGSEIVVVALDAARYVRLAEHRQPPLRDLELYRALQRPGTVLVSDNFARLNGLKSGTSFRLPTADGSANLVRVAGIVADYSSHRGTVFVDVHHAGLDPLSAPVDLFVLGLGSTAAVEESRQALTSADWAAAAGVEVMTRQAVRSHILGTIRRLHGVARLQEALTLLVAVLGVSAALLICVMQRRHELALMRALGATVGQVVTTVLVEAAIMAILGASLGIPLGLAAQWYVLAVVLFHETGFQFPLQFPWADVVTVTTVVGGAVIVAALAPARLAARSQARSALVAEH